MRSRLFSLTGLALLMANTVAQADINGFGDFSGFAVHENDSATPPSISGETIKITNHAGGEARSIFYKLPQSVSEFEATFTYQAAVGSSDFAFCPSAAFVIENSAQGANAIGTSGLNFGYSGIKNSVAVSLQLSGVGSGSGLYSNGNVGGGSVTTAPVNLVLGNPVDVILDYKDERLTETLTDTVTHAKFSTAYLIDIPQTIGSDTAYIGFTAATDNSTTQDQFISNFTYHVPEVSPLFLLSAGGVFLAVSSRWVRRRHA